MTGVDQDDVECEDCGHPRHAHEHLRLGTDCCFCECLRFRAPYVSWWTTIWRAFRGKTRADE